MPNNNCLLTLYALPLNIKIGNQRKQKACYFVFYSMHAKYQLVLAYPFYQISIKGADLTLKSFAIDFSETE